MNEPRAQEQIETLEAEKQALLDELEQAYLLVSRNLVSTRQERDVTYQALRNRNEELQDHLEKLETVHTALEKAHGELKHTQQMLIRSERLAAMGEMAAAIVHEIRNPLTGILGNLELMHVYKKLPTEKQLEVLYQSAQYLHRLTNNILGFSRKQKGVACEVDLNRVLENLMGFLTPFYKRVEIEMVPDPEIPEAWADPNKVEQILMNLVLNAVDAMDKRGEVRLESGKGTILDAVAQMKEAGRPSTLAVEMSASELEKEYVIARVVDNGPGISAEHLGRVFEAFYTTKEEGKGTGLGLSIVRTIVEEFGGNLLLDSKEGEGAVFTVFLPRSPA